MERARIHQTRDRKSRTCVTNLALSIHIGTSEDRSLIFENRSLMHHIYQVGEGIKDLPGISSMDVTGRKGPSFIIEQSQKCIDVDFKAHSFRLQLHQEPSNSLASVSTFLYHRDSVVLGSKLWSLRLNTSSTNLLPALQHRRTIPTTDSSF
jgi:hypothetical protein